MGKKSIHFFYSNRETFKNPYQLIGSVVSSITLKKHVFFCYIYRKRKQFKFTITDIILCRDIINLNKGDP